VRGAAGGLLAVVSFFPRKTMTPSVDGVGGPEVLLRAVVRPRDLLACIVTTGRRKRTLG
jgi:hypothetical protein